LYERRIHDSSVPLVAVHNYKLFACVDVLLYAYAGHDLQVKFTRNVMKFCDHLTTIFPLNNDVVANSRIGEESSSSFHGDHPRCGGNWTSYAREHEQQRIEGLHRVTV